MPFANVARREPARVRDVLDAVGRDDVLEAERHREPEREGRERPARTILNSPRDTERERTASRRARPSRRRVRAP